MWTWTSQLIRVAGADRLGDLAVNPARPIEMRRMADHHDRVVDVPGRPGCNGAEAGPSRVLAAAAAENEQRAVRDALGEGDIGLLAGQHGTDGHRGELVAHQHYAPVEERAIGFRREVKRADRENASGELHLVRPPRSHRDKLDVSALCLGECESERCHAAVRLGYADDDTGSAACGVARDDRRRAVRMREHAGGQ